MEENRSIDRKWILIPGAVLVVWLIFFFLPMLLINKLWTLVIFLISLFPVYGCILYCRTKLKCPACGAPLYAVNYRYVVEHKREIYCVECGRKIQIR